MSYMVSKKEFERILERYLNGTAEVHEIKWIEKWYSSLEHENNFPVLSQLEQQVLDRADFAAIRSKVKTKRKTVAMWPWLAVAAGLLIGVFLVESMLSAKVSSVNESTATVAKIEFFNEAKAEKTITLKDSSKIILRPGSRIKVFGDFNDKDRKVSLKGEAFFSVVHDEKRPFKVYAYDVVTTVLGTSFTINAPSLKEKVTVVVRTGRVAVSTNGSDRGDSKGMNQEVIVTPNQQAIFDPTNNRLKASLIQNPAVLDSPHTQKLIYDEEPIVNILIDTEELFGVDIRFDATILDQCRITTAFQKEGLFERLNILSKSIGANYVVDGTSIVFKSSGCGTNQ